LRCITIFLLSLPLSAQDDGAIITDDVTGVSYRVELYLSANYPVALVFASDGRLFYTEKTTGNVRVVSADGERQPEPVITLPTTALAERGMLGITLDPDYENNGMIWVAHSREATQTEFAAFNIVRFHEEDGVGSDPQVMYNLPLENNALIHLGGNLRFDANGYLFVSIGNHEIPANSQNLDTPQGAIHRFEVTDDGLIPAPGNPFDGNSIYAYGLRNPFDFVIDPYGDGRRLFSVENGDACDDEINVILPGLDYGAGENYTCGGVADGVDLARYRPPLIAYTPTIAPTGILVYDDPAIPEWQGDIFYCAWNTGEIYRMRLNENRNQMESVHALDLGSAQCRIDIVIGPEGGFYFTAVSDEGGMIYRLIPVNQ
jgi:glucose/arabinose dehydrogenase